MLYSLEGVPANFRLPLNETKSNGIAILILGDSLSHDRSLLILT